MRTAACLALLAVGCDSGLSGGGGEPSDTDAAGAGADTDTDATSDLDCDADYLARTPAPGSTGLGSCVTQEVTCGDVIYATNTGGSTIYAYDYWEEQQVLGPYLGDTEVWDGPERSYVFRGLQEGEGVRLRVESCMDVWATWIRYGDVGGEFCDLDPFTQAGAWESSNGPRERWTDRVNPSSAAGYDFEFQIEGLFGAEGNFELTVECF